MRKEGRRERAALYREVKEAHLKEAHELEQTHRLAVLDSAKQLEEKLDQLNFPTDPSVLVKPCATFREAITTCYKANGKDNPLACAGEVEAFTECAKQLSRLSH